MDGRWPHHVFIDVSIFFILIHAFVDICDHIHYRGSIAGNKSPEEYVVVKGFGLNQGPLSLDSGTPALRKQVTERGTSPF